MKSYAIFNILPHKYRTYYLVSFRGRFFEVHLECARCNLDSGQIVTSLLPDKCQAFLSFAMVAIPYSCESRGRECSANGHKSCPKFYRIDVQRWFKSRLCVWQKMRRNTHRNNSWRRTTRVVGLLNLPTFSYRIIPCQTSCQPSPLSLENIIKSVQYDFASRSNKRQHGPGRRLAERLCAILGTYCSQVVAR